MKRSDDPKDKPLASEGRRGFFKRALLGAGALTVSCTTPLEAQKKVTPKPTTPTIDPKTAKENWYPKTPSWNVYDHGNNDYLQLRVHFHDYPESVIKKVDKEGEQVLYNYFTYNGQIPGPTVRMKGDETLRIHLNNHLPANDGYYACINAARTVMGNKLLHNDDGVSIPDYAIYHHVVGPHQQHVTNLHTHGLHVSPGKNKGFAETDSRTHSDNVLLRIIPKEDYDLRMVPESRSEYEKEVLGNKIFPLKDDEVIGDAYYNFKLGTHRGPHYPGTQWYHPHPHGATFDQVASGMAGFLIIEGDVDEKLAEDLKDHDYRERLFVIQRLSSPMGGDQESPRVLKYKIPKKFIQNTINGRAATDENGNSTSKLVAVMKPGQVEHWRFLNGSVDGNGYFFIMVTKGEEAPKDSDNPSNNIYPKLVSPFKAKEGSKYLSEDGRVRMDNLAFDGVTLVEPNEKGDDANYTTMPLEWIAVGPANRTDFLFEAPQLEDGEDAAVYTIWTQYLQGANDSNFLFAVQSKAKTMRVATIVVRPSADGSTCPPVKRKADGKMDLPGLYGLDVPVDLMPIGDEEIKMTPGESTQWYNPDANGGKGKFETFTAKEGDNKIRSRRVMYSGFGHFSVGGSKFCFKSKTETDPKTGKQNQVCVDNYTGETFNTGDKGLKLSGVIIDDPVVPYCGGVDISNLQLPGNAAGFKTYNAMLIDGKKFGANTSECEGWDTPQHKMALNTAEEWTMFNYSMSVSTKFDKDGGSKNGTYNKGIREEWDYGLPYFVGSTRATTLANPTFHTAKSVHHPFHMHQNPFYVMSVKDQYGQELLPTKTINGKEIPIPRWQDTVWIPRNGGRVIMRSRFWDYTGEYVNHCHLLQHEDWGMMQAVEVVAPGTTGTPNFLPLEKDNPFPYPALSLRQMFILNMGMMNLLVDPDSDYYETTSPKNPKDSSSAKYLFYDPNDTTFFKQDVVKTITTKDKKLAIDESILNVAIPKSASSAKQKEMTTYDPNLNPNAYGPFPLWAGTGRESLYDLSKVPFQDPYSPAEPCDE
jgi:FtsP/CotA-like multicopper oxidase with cupredoxin domain